MRRIQRKSVQTLIEPHLDVLFRTAFRLTRNQADAEDLVQETCVRACPRVDERRQSPEVRTWLLRVLHNLFIDDVRRTQRSPIVSIDNGSEATSTFACADPTPEESFAAAEREAQLERAWHRLDRGHRALLALRAEGYTLAEIAVITGLETDALNMRLYRARKGLTRGLREEEALKPELKLEAVK